jgi:hypothetical protein
MHKVHTWCAKTAQNSPLRRVYARAGVRYPPHAPCAVSVNRHKGDRFALLQLQHAPNLVEGLLGELPFPFVEPNPFGIVPQSLLLFWGEVFQLCLHQSPQQEIPPIGARVKDSVRLHT